MHDEEIAERSRGFVAALIKSFEALVREHSLESVPPRQYAVFTLAGAREFARLSDAEDDPAVIEQARGYMILALEGAWTGRESE